MEHPAFEEAGADAGVEIWTIEKFEPVAIDKKTYGKFYNGDSYIVLKTTGDPSKSLSYDAHFWLGSKTTQDKKGSAAILTVTLDDMLGGKAVHHREVQGYESSQFLGYFKPAVRYMEGGNESGFNEVTTNAGAEKRLLKLSGCDNMRIEEVEADASSLTKEHCFILEVEHDIFVLMPEGAKATQRRKIISVANTLRDDYHNGRATIEIIDEFSSDEDLDMFFEALGSGSKDDIADAQSTEAYTREDQSAVYLYRVLLGDDQELVSLSKPYKQSQLSSSETYILDTPCSGVYVWIGTEVDADTKKTYNDVAQKYLDSKSYPAWIHVTRVSEGSENANFKQYFHNWDSISSSSLNKYVAEVDAGYFSSDAEDSAAAAKMIGKSASARGYMPDQGEGSFTMIRIAGEQKEETKPILFQNEVNVLKYQYTDEDGNDAYVVYFWIGVEASDDDKNTALELVTEYESELENAAFVKVPSGKEPKHFLSLFKGNLVIMNSDEDSDEDMLFRVEGTQTGVDMRAVQVPKTSDILEDDDVFVLKTSSTIYVWDGKESEEKEHEAAEDFVKNTLGDKEVVTIKQGDEPDNFWEILGGQGDEKEDASGWRKTVSRRVTTPPTLTAVTVSVTGKIKFEDLETEFTQQDLSEDGVYILDTGEELYLWQGKDLPERVKNARGEMVKEYIIDDGLERTVESALVVSLRQGSEPAIFKKLFPSWDNEMWANLSSYDDIKNETKAANSK